MKKSFNTTQYTTIILLLSIVAAGLLIWVYNKELDKRLNQITDYKTQIVEASLLSEDYSIIRSQTEKVDLLSGRMNNLFLDKDNLIYFFELLENLSDEHNVKINLSGANLSEDTFVVRNSENIPYEKLTLVVSVEGNINQVLNFLRSVEGLPQSIKITNTRLSVFDQNIEGETIERWSLSFSLNGITK